MCGIIGIYSINKENIIYDLQEGLYHLQHRGQDSYGYAVPILKNNQIVIYKDKGLIKDNLNNYYSHMGIGHTRYPTKGSNTINEAQPLYFLGEKHNISLIHNGQIWITETLLNYFTNHNIPINMNITSDSAMIVSLLGYHINKYDKLDHNIIKNIVVEICDLLEGSYNIICMIENYGLICFKDKNSIRPLILGKKDDIYLISSESISLTSLDYDIVTDIYNNELYIFNDDIKKYDLDYDSTLKPCIFEWIYLAREETTMYNVNVYEARFKMGEYLANKIKRVIPSELLNEIDYIIPIPDTSKPCALSISKNLKISYCEGITKNRYVNRTFIMDTQDKRRKNIKRKLNVVNHLIENKNLIIVDDSIVRGNTIKHIVNLLKKHNAKKIIIISCSPEIINENKYGIDIPDKNKLICYNSDINKELDVEYVLFQDIEDLKKSIQFFNPNIKEFEDSIFRTN